MSIFTPYQLAWLRTHRRDLPTCDACGYPMRRTEPDQTHHPLCDPATIELIRSYR